MEEEESVEFHLQLNCTSRKASENKTLTLSSFPASVLELKKAIEAKFSIPACVQSVSYQLAPLTNKDSLKKNCIRSGDTLSISYLCEAECRLIDEVIKWLRSSSLAVRCGGASADELIWRGIHAGYLETLPIELFDWLSPKAYSNKLYFESVGGLTVLVNLYRYLAGRKWEKMPPLFKCLESFSIQSIGNFGEDFPLRRMSLKEGVLDCVLSSVLRKRLEMREPIVGFGYTGDPKYEDDVWRCLLTDAVYIISKYV